MTIEDLISNEGYKEKFVLQKLICYFLDYSKEEMWLHVHQKLSPTQEQKILNTYHEVADNNKPLEYVLGFVEFFKRKFYVNENTLIPRPETEYMIMAVTEEIDSIREKEGPRGEQATCALDDSRIGNPSSNFCLLDIGTGSGVLGISVLLQNPCFFQRAIFTDISEKALAVAQQNYEIQIKDHDFPVEFIKSDLLEFVDNLKFKTCPDSVGVQNLKLIIVANLPYIPEKTFDENVADNVKKREPKMAFVAGDDGLIYYRKMLNQIIMIVESQKSIRSSKSKPVSKGPDDVMALGRLTLFLEMMTRQGDILRQEYKDHFIFEDVKTFHFNIRMVKVTLK